MAAWKASVSASACVRRRSSTGVRSAPPPNHHLDVTTMRVFMCTAGTLGFCGCAMSEMPEAQNSRVLLGARDLLAELGRELAEDGRGVDADLLEHAPRHQAHDAAAAGSARMIRALPGRALEAAGRAVTQGAPSPAARPRASRRRRRCWSRSSSNQACALAFSCCRSRSFRRRPLRLRHSCPAPFVGAFPPIYPGQRCLGRHPRSPPRTVGISPRRHSRAARDTLSVRCIARAGASCSPCSSASFAGSRRASTPMRRPHHRSRRSGFAAFFWYLPEAGLARFRRADRADARRGGHRGRHHRLYRRASST